MTRLDHVWKEPQQETRSSSFVPEHVADPRRAGRTHGSPTRQLAVLGISVAVAALVAAWLFLHRDTSAAPTFGLTASSPALVTQAQLEGLAGAVGHPVYWAGPKAGYSYEATVTRGGRFYVRYLPSGTRAGDPRASFLVVGTYTEPGSFVDLKRAAKQDGSVSVGIDRGGIIVFSSDRPSSVYFSYPGAKYQVEVYSPSGNAARGLVLGGKITPIRPAH
jgi:hypothetical protein